MDVIALPNAGRECVEMRNEAVQKKTAAYFQAAVYFSTVKCLRNGGKPNY